MGLRRVWTAKLRSRLQEHEQVLRVSALRRVVMHVSADPVAARDYGSVCDASDLPALRGRLCRWLQTMFRDQQ